jgi:uncharacterized protein YkwD
MKPNLPKPSWRIFTLTFLAAVCFQTGCTLNITADDMAQVQTAVAPYFATFTLPAPVNMGPISTPFMPIQLGTEIPAAELSVTEMTSTNNPSVPGTATLTPTKSVTEILMQNSPLSSGTSTNTPTRTLTTGSLNPTGTMTQTPTWIFILTKTSTPTVTQTRTFTPYYTRTNTSTPTRTRTPAPPTTTVNSTLVVPTGPVTPMQLINAVNQLRTANGFPALVVNSNLMGTAQWTAETMAMNHYMNHLVYLGLGYPGVRDRIAAAGYGPCATVWATENWAMGFPTLDAIMVAWSDAAHMLPMTQSYYKDIGAGVATGPWGTYYIVHAAYTTGTVCPSTPTVTKTETPTTTITPTLTSTTTMTLDPTFTNTLTTTSTSPAVCTATGNSSYENQLIDLINTERSNQGLAALTYNGSLTSAAQSHSLDMACQNFFSHTGSDGSSPFDRMSWAGYSFSAAAENIFAGSGSYDSPAQAFDAWMNSSGHRDNMLNPDYAEIGIGYAGNPSGAYTGYFTADFAKP